MNTEVFKLVSSSGKRTFETEVNKLIEQGYIANLDTFKVNTVVNSAATYNSPDSVYSIILTKPTNC